MPIEAIVGAGAASVQALNAVLPKLNGVRSVVIEVDNNSQAELRRTGDHHDHGGFAVTPVTVVPPAHADVYGSQNSSGSIGTGTEGRVSYHCAGSDITISWVNPFLGSNEAHATVSGGHLALVRVVTTAGAGNEKAHMRYEVFERAQPAWRFCTKCHAMFFDGFPDKGNCSEGGGHVAAGLVFVLPHDTPEPGQPAWRFCGKCHALFFDGFPDKGACPEGEGHVAAGFNFILPHDQPNLPGQPEWRHCMKCMVLFFDGFPDKGTCPRDGQGHQPHPDSFRFVIPHHP